MDVRISRIFTGFLRIFETKIRKNPVKIREIRTSIHTKIVRKPKICARYPAWAARTYPRTLLVAPLPNISKTFSHKINLIENYKNNFHFLLKV
ncbi:MAG: hypothetical protein RL329_96 [Bacteroidota bacterium]|jgi:hypothetical protein